MPSATARPHVLTVPVLAVAAASALALVALDSSGASGALHHEGDSASVVALGRTVALYLAGWALMMLAMMLPTATGLLAAVGRLVDDSAAARSLEAATAAGFLGVWMAVGYAFRAGDLLVHAGVDAVGWLSARPQVVAAGVLVLAGGYQFSSLKRRCLTACRVPSSFVYRHWRGRNPLADAARIGVAYGTSCVGCCWALMLVMFAVGMANPVWMLVLGLAMAAEKNTAFGRRLSTPVGIGLLVAGGCVAIAG